MRHVVTALWIAIIVGAGRVSAQETPIASDYEIAAITKQLASEKNAISRIAGYLNLGDQLLSRQQGAAADQSFRSALDAAAKQRRLTRLHSQLGDYALATAYQGLACARLGRKGDSFDLFEEATRYVSDSDKLWNLYASAMMFLNDVPKAVAASRNAVSIAASSFLRRQSVPAILDLAVDRYTLAQSLNRGSDPLWQDEARVLLETLLRDLGDARLDPLRKEIVRREMFEIYSTTRSDESTYIALNNRSHLALASIYEKQFQIEKARAEYREILKVRSDDPIALQRMARLSTVPEDQIRSFQKAFEANPFSPRLLLDYEAYLSKGGKAPAVTATTGSVMRQVVEALVSGRDRDAASKLEPLQKKFPGNESLAYLASRVAFRLGDQVAAGALRQTVHDAELRAVLDTTSGSVPPSSALLSRTGRVVDPTTAELSTLLQLLRGNPTPEQLVALDQLTFSALVSVVDAETESAMTSFSSGRIGDVAFRFQERTKFRGDYSQPGPLRLEFRILGATDVAGRTALLLSPIRLEHR